MSNGHEAHRRTGIGTEGASPEPGSVLEDIAQLRQDAEDLQREFAVHQDPSAEYKGQDRAGAVRVALRGDGRVADVEVDRAWRDSVGVQGLSAAVLEAITNASMRRLTAWGKAVADEQAASGAVSENRAGRERGSAKTDSRAAPPADNADAREALHQVVSMLEGVERDLDDLERRVTQRVRREVVGRGPSNMVTVTMTGGGQVSGVDIQPRFLQQAHERRIAQELRSAFDAAYAKAGKLSLEAVLGDGQLAKLHSLGSDPAAMLRKLGFDVR